MSHRKPPKPAAPTAPPPAVEPAALLLTISLNRATGRMALIGNAEGEQDLQLLGSALDLARADVQQKLIAAAEARGAAKAKPE